MIKREINIILLLQFYSPPIYCVSGRFTATSSQRVFSHLEGIVLSTIRKGNYR
ncbi:hypothetical protein XCR1_1400011 [Xenorhabdus cabanillasii JM26]|uniref:Uncharacterized protein n=1 Tax=Xenorhabdus cabanillasii JM26 TaxID=1427517 RepID=W1ISF6_9GAMM|nr:hypothetical protein XCR1_1400011 [Xenorhabdus cabanillasii JM26]